MITETDALKRPFLIGLLACAIAFLLVGGVIAVFATTTDDRPEGVAERWLTAVGDLTRDGVHADALERVSAHGDPRLADELLGLGFDYKGKSAFEGLEVGKAKIAGDTARVPAKLTYRDQSESDANEGVVILQRDRDTWRVTALDGPDPTLRVPSEGGDVAAKAPLPLYAAGLVVGVGVAIGASWLVRLAGREQEQALA